MNHLQNPLVFSGQKAWIGHFADASAAKDQGDRKFTHLDRQCMICFSDFLPPEQVVVLPCTHGMHERCFMPWNAQTCPMDQTPSVGVDKITLLGQELLVPPRARKFAVWATLNAQKDANKQLRSFIEKGIHNHPLLIRELESLSRLMKIMGQDVFDLMEQRLSDEQINERALKTGSQILNEKLVREYLRGDRQKIGYAVEDALSLISLFAPRGDAADAVIQQAAIFIKTKTGLDLDQESGKRILKYVLKIADQIVVDSKQLFFTHHFKNIRGLPTEEEKIGYLQKLSRIDLQRLVDSTRGGGPTSETIQKIGKDITRKEAQRAFVYGLVLVAGFVAIGIYCPKAIDAFLDL